MFLKKLSNTHTIIHAHGNNYGPVNNNIPDVIEIPQKKYTKNNIDINGNIIEKIVKLTKQNDQSNNG